MPVAVGMVRPLQEHITIPVNQTPTFPTTILLKTSTSQEWWMHDSVPLDIGPHTVAVGSDSFGYHRQG
jgi:hypothetical protein